MKRSGAVSHLVCFIPRQRTHGCTNDLHIQIAAGRVSAYPKSPYIRSLQAAEYKWLTQMELAPRVVSEDEGGAYPVLEVEAVGDESEEGGEASPGTVKISGWTYYQRLNNNGQKLTKKDGTTKVMHEARHHWFLKDSVRTTNG